MSVWHIAAAAGATQVMHCLHALSSTQPQPLGAHAAAEPDGASGAAAVDVDVRDRDGRTPLMLACEADHAECAALLLRLGASATTTDKAGRSAVHYSAMGGAAVLDVVREHYEAQPMADEGGERRPFVSLPDARGLQPLHFASWCLNAGAAQRLLDLGACLWARSTSDCYSAVAPCNAGSTPLHLVAMRGSDRGGDDLASVLLRAFAKMPAEKRLLGWEPAAHLAGSGGAGAAADLRSATDGRGKTALTLARSRGAGTALLLLLDPCQPLPWELLVAARGEAPGPAPPPPFVCPITAELMNDPVVAADGHSYERAAIAKWLRCCRSRPPRSPLTNLPLESAGLVANHALRAAIADWREWQQSVAAGAAAPGGDGGGGRAAGAAGRHVLVAGGGTAARCVAAR